MKDRQTSRNVIVAIIIVSILLLDSRSSASTFSLLSQIEKVNSDSTILLAATAMADGNLRQLAAAPESAEATSANGSIGVRLTSKKWRLFSFINIASTVDTIRSDFGASLLQPSTGGALKAGLFDYQRLFWTSIKKQHGKSLNLFEMADSGASALLWRFYINASSAIWADTLNAKGISILNYGAGLIYEKTYKKDDIISFRAEFSLSLRQLLGDANKDFRKELTDTKRSTFPAFESGFSLTINSITAGLQFVLVDNKNDGKIAGLTGGQVSAGIGISADLFTLTRKKANQNNNN